MVPSGGLGPKRLVRVPHIGAPGRVVGIVVENDQFWSVFRAGREGMHGQIAEAPREGLLVLWSDILVAEDNHFVFNEGGLDGCECCVVEGPGQIDTLDFRAAGGSDLADLQGIFRIQSRFTHFYTPSS